LLDLASILLILTQNRHFLRAEFGLWAEDAIPGVFGGGRAQTIGTAPNSQERAVYKVDFQEGGEAGLGEGTRGGETTTTDSPRTPPWVSAGTKKIRAEN